VTLTTDLLTDTVERARALVPVLRERAQETDDLRRLPDASMADLDALGLLGLATPREVGGGDIGPDGIIDVCLELGRGSGAVAWVGGNFAVHNLLITMFPEEAQREVFGGAEGRMPHVATGFSPLRGQTAPVDGGAVISGQWDFASGVDHADWVIVMAMAPEGPLAHLVPRAELTVVDTWHTTGLRGTGSKDVAAQDVFVPQHRILNMIPPTEGQSVGRELYDLPWLRVPMSSFFGAGVVSTVLGTARGALEVFVERTSGNIGGLSGVKVSARPEIAHKLGESAADIDGAEAALRASYADMRAAGVSGRPITMDDRLRWRRDAAWCAKVASGAVRRLYEVGGAHVLFVGDQLDQFQRDNVAASHHYGMAWDTLFAGYGRSMLGQEAGVAMV
jgi:3-hydroxy-9,10-secoandrosta-1,3,5(10)-triene-9,17-dione monooxygenase